MVDDEKRRQTHRSRSAWATRDTVIPLFLPFCAPFLVACRHAVDEREEPIPIPVHCLPAARAAVVVTETLRGRVAAPPGGDLPVASQVPGRVIEVLAHEGDHIAAGAVVASVDDVATRGALTQANAALDQAKSAAANADATLERTRQLVARGIAAKQELDDAVARAAQAHSGITASVAAAEVARRTFGRVQVRTTFEGVVTRVWRGPGALVDGTAATPIIQLASTTLAELDADATERQLVDVAPGQLARIVLASGGDALAGFVRARSTALDPATGLGLVRIAIETNSPVLLGVFGTATLTIGERQGVLVLPASAMRGAVADGAQIAICKDGKAELRTVRAGWRDDEHVEVVDGISEGERVAIDHVLGLETGTPIAEQKQ